jgi:hypothetical protein
LRERRASFLKTARSFLPILQGNEPPDWPKSVLLHWGSNKTAVPPYWGVRTSRYLYTEFANDRETL